MADKSIKHRFSNKVRVPLHRVHDAPQLLTRGRGDTNVKKIEQQTELVAPLGIFHLQAIPETHTYTGTCAQTHTRKYTHHEAMLATLNATTM